MSRLPVDQLLYNLSIAGFAGLYIDRFGYQDRAAELEAKLVEILQRQPLVSPDQRLSYFDITAYGRTILPSLDPATLARLKDEILYPIEDYWEGEASATERNEEDSWRWCGNEAQVTFINRGQRNRKQRVSMEIHPAHEKPYQVVLEGPGFRDTVKLENRIEKYERILEIPAQGRMRIALHSDGPSLRIPSDPRKLVFAIYNVRLQPLDEPERAPAPAAARPVVEETWGGSCYALEKNEEESWHWCGSDGELILTNPSDAPRQQQMSMQFRLDRPQPYAIDIRSDAFRRTIQVQSPVEKYTQTINIPAHGRLVIHFHSPAAPLQAPNDTRTLVFAVYNFKLEDTN